MKFRLPLLVEHSVGRVEVLRHDLAKNFEQRVMAEVSKTDFRVTCQVGCAWCCHHPLSISILEGICIYRWLLRQGKWTLGLKQKLKLSADQQFGTTYEVWILALIPCPLLGEKNMCLVYPARPLICRAYYAVSDPHFCHPHRLGSETQVIPRDSIVDPFHEEQEKILRKHNMQLLTLPLGLALLLAERVCTGDLDLGMVDSVLLKEYGEKS